jgi:hypothetical protein
LGKKITLKDGKMKNLTPEQIKILWQSHDTCAVASENAAMLRFFRRHLQPYLTGISESRQVILRFG